MLPDMSPELIGIIGVGVGLLTVIIAFAGLMVTLLLRMDHRIDRTNECIDHLIDEVRAIAQAQARTDHQVEVLTDQVKELAGQMKDLVAEVKSLAIAQARTDEQVQALVQAQARTDEQLKGLTAEMKDLTVEVKGIAQAQASADQQVKTLSDQVKDLVVELKDLALTQSRVDYQVKGLTDQVKDLTEQMKESVEELKTVGQNQARLEGEVLILKDAILLGAVGQGVR